MDSGQFDGADFISDVGLCQLVGVEHFFLCHEIQDVRQKKYNFSSIASKLLHLDPMYKLGY